MLWLVKTPNLHWQQGQNSQTLQVQSGSLFSATTCKSLRCLQCGKDWIGLMATRILWAPGSKELPRSKPMATSENNPLPPTPYGLPWANALWYMPSSLIGTQVWIGVSGGTPCQAEVQRCRFTIYIYMSRDPHTPPHPARWFPPLWQGRGGFLSSQAMVYVVFIVHIMHMYR